MLFSSPIFLFAFLPLVLAGFALLRGHGRACVLWLIAASMAFYAYWSVAFLALLAVSTLVNWSVGHILARVGPIAARRAVLIAGLAWNLGLLAYFKYADFLIGSADALGADWPLLHVVLPLGISFFTFQKIAYLVDIHRGDARPGRLEDFALFVFFFPQLIAGPITHHAEMVPQIAELRRDGGRRGLSWNNAAIGGTLLLLGLIKKVAIADQIAPLATPVFDAAAQGLAIGAQHAWQAALAYTLQLYFDFSGYSDMAIGLARLFGLKLPRNFDSPYRATSIIDFWRRWHITLSRFLRDYLYIPLGGNRAGPTRRYANLMIVMLLGGLWHGAGWTFVLWGGLHGLYLLVAHGWRALRAPRVPLGLAWVVTMFAVIVAWVLFRAPTLDAAGNLLAGMIGRHGWTTAIAGVYLPARTSGLLIPLALLAFAALAPNTQEVLRRFDPVLGQVRDPAARWRAALQWPVTRGWGTLAGVLAAIVVTLLWKTSEFLYFQF